MRSFSIVASSLAVWSTVAACAALPEAQSPAMFLERAGLRKLNGEEIRRLLVGRTLSFVNEPGALAVTSAHQEMYREDGTVFVRVDRGAGQGRFSIVGDRLCLVVESDPERCRHLFVAENGAPYLMPLGEDYVPGSIRIRVED